MPSTGWNGGTTRSQRPGMNLSQRGWKGQPGTSSSGPGTVPRMVERLPSAASGEPITLRIRATV